MVSRSLIKADFLMLLVTLIAASGWLFTKEALAGFPPLLFMGIRFLSAGVIVGLVGQVNVTSIPARQFRFSVLVGIVFGLAMVLWILGIATSNHLGEGAFITSLGMILVPWAGLLIFKEKVYRCHQLAIGIALVGLGCLLLSHGFQFQPAQFLFLGTAILLAIHFTLNSRVSTYTSTFSLTTIQLIVVGAICLSLGVLTESWPDSLQLSHWLWLGLSVLIATSLRFFIQTEAQGLSPTTHAALIMILEPVWAALLMAVWFGEMMSAIQLLGCGLIFIALLVSRILSF